jgi:hypothetical protein
MIILIILIRKGKEFKAPRHASAAATCDRNLRQSAGNLLQIAGIILSLRYSLPTLILGILKYFIY